MVLGSSPSNGNGGAKAPAFNTIVWSLTRPHPAGFLAARWIVLRGLGVVFFSAFYSYAFQIQGLIGPHGISPAVNYLAAAQLHLEAPARYFQVPSIFWLMGAGATALRVAIGAGLVTSLLLVINLAPRVCIALCTLLFLSIIGVSGVFASYQSDGMLLEAGLVALFFAPAGIRPGIGVRSAPSRIARFLLVWEWFRIYFESGVVKLASGDPQWQDLTALDHYYENGPLPTWIGWYVQHLPHAFHAIMTLSTLLIELVLVWAVFLPRRYRLLLFALVTPLQMGIIATANYAFLNYLVLLLGVLLVDDVAVKRGLVSLRRYTRPKSHALSGTVDPLSKLLIRLRMGALRLMRTIFRSLTQLRSESKAATRPRLNRLLSAMQLVFLALVFYATLLRFPLMSAAELPAALRWPADALEPFRFANGYGLFAVMTRERYEIEFQGTLDGETYVPYPFRYKPQNPKSPPGIYAPYQPRFEWNLWFASLGNASRSPWVLHAAAGLLRAEPDVLYLFAFDPFRGKRPREVRTVVYRYWFSSFADLRKRGVYWRRELLGTYAPTLRWADDGSIEAVGPSPAK